MQGEDGLGTLYVLNNVGRAQRGLGRLAEAEELGAEAVRRLRGACPPGNGLIGVALTQHALTLVAMERFEPAEQELIEAHKILAAALGPTFPPFNEAIKALADLYSAWHAAEPGKGHDAAAAEWKAKLGTMNAPAPAQPERKP